MDTNPPPLHHLLPVPDSAHSLLVLLHPYQLHIKISPTALLPVLFQRYASVTYSYANES